MASRKLIILDIVLAVLGIILIVIGGALFPILDKQIKETVEKSVRLENNSKGFDSWKIPPAPIYISFYFFNVSNAEDVVKKGSAPNLTEHGPFTYREFRDKTNLGFSENGDTIRFREHKSYVFERELSGDDDNFTICTLNIPILTLATQLRFADSVVQRLMSDALFLFGETLFQCHSVKELLWGYTPTSVKDINFWLEKFGFEYRLNYTFGIYTGPTANGTDDGEMDIFTGVGNINQLGMVDKWRNSSLLPYWRGDCNRINGTDGTIWHPFVDRTERMYVFNTDICRSIYLEYDRDVLTSPSQITTLRFKAPASVMADPRSCPDNRCFCSPYDANGTFCLHAGVLNVSICRQDAPIIMSQPHFFEAPTYVDKVNGMHPDAAKHQTILDVEPITGVTLNASKRIQINMFVENLETFKDTQKLEQGIVFPISWVDEHAAIPEDEAKDFYDSVIRPMKIADGVRYGLVALGGFVLLCALVLLVYILVKREKAGKATIEPEDDPLLVG